MRDDAQCRPMRKRPPMSCQQRKNDNVMGSDQRCETRRINTSLSGRLFPFVLITLRTYRFHPIFRTLSPIPTNSRALRITPTLFHKGPQVQYLGPAQYRLRSTTSSPNIHHHGRHQLSSIPHPCSARDRPRLRGSHPRRRSPIVTRDSYGSYRCKPGSNAFTTCATIEHKGHTRFEAV